VDTSLGALRQINQQAADLDRAIEFYRDVLGIPLIARFGALSFFDMGGVRLLLEQGVDPNAEPGNGSVLYFAVDHIHDVYRELGERGVEFVDEPHVIFTDSGGTFGEAGLAEWMVFFRDTEGNLLALSSREPPQ
jgi:catechol 2,3-dioxygenase-like lactoylglutathione lyase family enzyme